MVQPSQSSKTKTAILEALKDHTSPEKAIGYNKLFDVVSDRVGGSRRTFHKYLGELVTTGAVKKDKDPRHKAGVIIYRTEAATQEQVLIELTDRIFAMTKPSSILKEAMYHDIGVEARKRGIRKKEDVTDDFVRQTNESVRMWRMAQVSDVLGKHFRRLISLGGIQFTYAYARVTKDAKGREKAEVSLISDDDRAKLVFSVGPPGEKQLPGMFTISRGRGVMVPLPSGEKSMSATMERFAAIDILTEDGLKQASRLVKEILAGYPPAERERIEQAMRESGVYVP